MVSEISEVLDNPIAVNTFLTANEEEIQPVLPIRFQMEIPAGLTKKNLMIYEYRNNGWNTLIPTVKGDQISFLISDSSLFVLGNKKEEIIPPSGTDSSDSGSIGESVNTIPGAWKKDDIGWWYQKIAGGYITSSWAQIDGLWYYFDGMGYMNTGWILVDGLWYFMNPNGSMAESCWISWENSWYYLGWNGAMAVNTVTPDGFTVGKDGAWIQQ